VKEGQVLIDLDPTRNQAETSHLKSDLIAAKLDVARLHAALSDGDVLAKFDPPEGAPAALVAQVDDRLANLSPGMAVTVEIKTGTRRIISYLLSPLMRYAQNSLLE